MAKNFEDFKRLYPLSKTLRFEAKPIGATLDNIIKSGLLDEDEHRAASYVKMKKLIDEYHKVFIDRVLDNGCLPLEDKGDNNSLAEYYESYVSKAQDEDAIKKFKEIQQNLCSIIAKKLTDDKAYANLFGNKLIEYINLYNQQHKDDKLPKLKALFKQILSDRNAISWLPEEFNSDQEVLNAIKDCYERLAENVLGDKVLKSLLCSLSDYTLDGIFIRNDLQLTDISQKMFGNWGVIQNAIMQNIKRVAPARKHKESEEDYEKRIAGIFKKADSFSISYINDCLNEADPNNAYFVENSNNEA